MKTLITILALAFCAITPAALSDSKKVDATRFDFKSNIGLVISDEDNHLCLDIKNSSLSVGDTIAMVSTDKRQAVHYAKIMEKLNQSCSKVNDDTSESHYRVESVKGKLVDSPPYIAVVSNNASFAVKNRRITADLDDDGKPEYFRSCFSTEGMHFTIWSGQGRQEKRRWHRYYYLGYDVEPNCTVKEGKEK